MNLNSSPSPFPIQQIAAHDNNNNDDDQHRSYNQSFGPVNHSSCRIFFNSNRDHMAYYDPHQIYQSHDHQPEKNYDYDYGGSTYGIKNRSGGDGESSGLKLSLWKKEDVDYEKSIDYPVKWMSSKTRLNRTAINATERTKIEGDQYLKMQPYNNNNSSSPMENDHHLISSSSPIRVCADCSTTKTPLWRSGPKGPKSLCNACGIRQRKARRAVAAAAAAAAASAASGVAAADPPTPPPAKMIKVQHKEKIGKNATNSPQMKKRCKTTTPVDADSSLTDESSNKKKKIGNKLEEFLINLSKNLSFHRMFPEDEKDAAILLMALSSGLVHG